MNDDKVQLKVYIPEKIMDRFREMIALKHQRIERGLISFEVTQAIQQYVASHKVHTQGTQKLIAEDFPTKPNPIIKVHELKTAIQHYLLDNKGYEDIYQVPRAHLLEAIAAIKGTDKRTVSKWGNLLVQYHCIKWINAGQVEFV